MSRHNNLVRGRGKEVCPSRVLQLPSPQPSLELPTRIRYPETSSFEKIGDGEGPSSIEFFASTPFNMSPKSPSDRQNETIQSQRFPITSAGYGTIINRGESLLKSLSILARIQRIDQDKQRLGRGTGAQQSQSKNKNASTKRPEKVEAQSFIFTKDMFNTSNPTALQHVTHFLFEILDPKEAEAAFRGCWPAYERKQEAEYRKAAFAWVTKITKENPEFFPNCGLQFSLFISPCGDRFLRFISLFTSFVMHTVMQRRQKPENEHGISKPNYTAHSSEKQAQIQKFQLAKSELIQKSISTVEATMNLLEKHTEKQANYTARKTEFENLLSEKKERLSKIIQEKPHLFPEDALEQLDIRAQDIRKEALSGDWDVTNCPISEDSLAIVISKEWKQKVAHLRDSFSKVEEFCKKHVKLCQLVEAVDTQGEIVFDGNKLKGLNKETLDLGQYFQRVHGTIEAFCNEAEEIEKPSEELLEAISYQQERESFLTHRKAQPNFSESMSSSQFEQQITMTATDEEQLRQEITFETKALQMKLDGVKWDRLSKCECNTSPEKLFTWTPLKALDFANGLNCRATTTSNDIETTPKRRDLMK